MHQVRQKEAGIWFWLANATVLLMAGNIVVNGWNCWGRRPGGEASMILYAVLLGISVPSAITLCRDCVQVPDPRLKAALAFVILVLVVGHIIVTAIFGTWIFTSMHGGTIYKHSAFLSSATISASAGWLRKFFPVHYEASQSN